MSSRSDKAEASPQVEGPRALRLEEHPSAIKLLNSSLRPDGPPMISKEYPLVLGKGNLENMRVVVRGKEVISHAAIWFSKLRTRGVVFNVGGIGSVATHSAYQGQGLASAVMRDCIEIMRTSRCHLSVLWTQEHDFYRKLGYEAAGSEYLFRPTATDFARIQCDCTVVPYSRRHLSAVIDLHEREVLRTERSKEEYEAYLGIPKTKALVAMRGNSVTAYAVMGKGEDFRYCVHEWGGEARDLLCLVRTFFSSSNLAELIILTPVQESEFTRLLQQMQVPKAFEYLAMMKVIDADGLSKVLNDYLFDRLGQDFRISRDGSGLKVQVGTEEAPVEREQTLVRALFGPDSPSDLLCGFSHETASALDEALPIPLFIWGLDSV